jgi:tRNA 2-thiouridine synthesizing protein A
VSHVVDARGLACPLPVIRLAAAARDLPDGTLVTVLWTDPAAEHDIPAWARMRGHRVLAGPAADDDPAPAGRSTTVLLAAGDAHTHDGPAPTGTGPS